MSHASSSSFSPLSSSSPTLAPTAPCLASGVHGGERLRLARLGQCQENDILDFSINVRPDGPPEYLRLAMLQGLSKVGLYPSAHAEEAKEAAASYYGLLPEHFVFGNGSNELIAAIARMLKKRQCPLVAIPEPAFAEYALACQRVGLSCLHLDSILIESKRKDPLGKRALLDWRLPIEHIVALPQQAAVFIANPGNPAGTFLPKQTLLSLTAKRPDLTFIIDEAFISYLGRDSLVSVLPELKHSSAQLIVLRSLTKFHALAGLRLGFVATQPELAQCLQAELPAWNVNCVSLAAAVALLQKHAPTAQENAGLCSSASQAEEQKNAPWQACRAHVFPIAQAEQDARQERARNRRLRRQLLAWLCTLPLQCCRSSANYILFRLDQPLADLNQRLLRHAKIAVRDCANYQGLESQAWYRVCVRSAKDNARLVQALREILCPQRQAPSFLRMHKPALMLQGTSSGAGKSILAAAFCRILRQDGFDCAPFKAQNMSLNSGVTLDGLELGRAQIVQALACGLDPDVRMNPLLLKPHSDQGSQIVLLGQAQSSLKARDYLKARASFWPSVQEAYRSLAAEHEVMVLEGAGSPAEVNLKQADIVNMAMAKAAQAQVLLVGDIDRGGVYASFLGSFLTFSQSEQDLLAGFLVNRFRGDATLLKPAHRYLEQATTKPVLGVIPFIKDLLLPEEDSLSLAVSVQSQATLPEALDVAMIELEHTSNFTDIAPLVHEPDVTVRRIRSVDEWGQPDLVLVPGSKNVVQDLKVLEQRGLAARIQDFAYQGGFLVGICGGMQLLGHTISDPLHIESESLCHQGLGILPIQTSLAPHKTLQQVDAVSTPLGVTTRGYEIHYGQTTLCAETNVTLLGQGKTATNDASRFTGLVVGHCWGTYLHGFFDDDVFRRAFLDHVRLGCGKKPQGRLLCTWNIDQALDRLAALVRQNVDLKAIYQRLGLSC